MVAGERSLDRLRQAYLVQSEAAILKENRQQRLMHCLRLPAAFVTFCLDLNLTRRVLLSKKAGIIGCPAPAYCTSFANEGRDSCYGLAASSISGQIRRRYVLHCITLQATAEGQCSVLILLSSVKQSLHIGLSLVIQANAGKVVEGLKEACRRVLMIAAISASYWWNGTGLGLRAVASG